MHEIFFDSSLFVLDNAGYRRIYRYKDIAKFILLAPERLQLYGEELIMAVLMYTIGRSLDPHPERRPEFDWIGVLLKLLLNYLNTR